MHFINISSLFLSSSASACKRIKRKKLIFASLEEEIIAKYFKFKRSHYQHCILHRLQLLNGLAFGRFRAVWVAWCFVMLCVKYESCLIRIQLNRLRDWILMRIELRSSQQRERVTTLQIVCYQATQSRCLIYSSSPTPPTSTPLLVSMTVGS